jgi:hypothetical protein
VDAIPEGLRLQFDVEEVYFGAALKNKAEASKFASEILERRGNLHWLDLFDEY